MSKEEKNEFDEYPDDLVILEGISCLSFNKDFTQCALSKKNQFVYIYEVGDISKPREWKQKYKLSSHVQYVCSLDWCPETNKILSCAHDKMCYVWSFENDKWTPNLLTSTTKLGFLSCAWNSRGDKFCIGSSSKNLFISNYDPETKWWVSEQIKKVHKSSVISCKIDPTSLFVISGGADNRIIVSSCYLPKVDDAFLNDQTKPLAQEFGTIVYKFDADSWITNVAWNSTGSKGFASIQNSTIRVIDYKDDKKDEEIKVTHSPVSMIVPRGENGFYAICFDRNIYDYEKENGKKWALKKTVTIAMLNKISGDKKVSPNSGAGFAANINRMQGMKKKDSLAITIKQTENVHPSLISSVHIKGDTMITTDLSGFIKFWKV